MLLGQVALGGGGRGGMRLGQHRVMIYIYILYGSKINDMGYFLFLIDFFGGITDRTFGGLCMHSMQWTFMSL